MGGLRLGAAKAGSNILGRGLLRYTSVRAHVRVMMAPERGGDVRLRSDLLEGTSDEGSIVLEKNFQRLRIGLEVRRRQLHR